MDVWEYTESKETTPAWAEPLARCWSWGLNCHAQGNPWYALLDLTGYSVDEYGVRIFPWSVDDWSLGWMELGYLADALTVWCERPYECGAWVAGLVDADGEGDH